MTKDRKKERHFQNYSKDTFVLPTLKKEEVGQIEGRGTGDLEEEKKTLIEERRAGRFPDLSRLGGEKAKGAKI